MPSQRSSNEPAQIARPSPLDSTPFFRVRFPPVFPESFILKPFQMPDQLEKVNCTDLGDFQRLLNKYRQLEDKIVFKLNCDFPTKSFKDAKQSKDAIQTCHEIEDKLVNIRKLRTDLFSRCIAVNKDIVQQFHNDESQAFAVRMANTTLRQIRNEQSVDEIIVNQTEKVVQDRCRKEAILG
uniref:Protein MIX23 n=1 Tax=Panagrellus redivivus TaxID=6233 RepID=A0A7E4VZA8_PANRE